MKAALAIYALSLAPWLLMIGSLQRPLSAATSPGECGEYSCVEEQDIGKLLANPNPMPIVVDDDCVQVAPGFDWEVQERMRTSIDQVIGDFEGNWEQLVGEFDNKRYCITFKYEQSVHNFSVGDVCRMIIAESLSCAYINDHPGTGPAYWRLLTPEVADRKDFGKWCLQQREQGRKLWELQVEACDRAAEIVRTRNLNIPTDERRSESIRKILADKASIQRTKSAIPLKTLLIPDLRTPLLKTDVKR